MNQIINAAKCNTCGSIVVSAYMNDYHECPCGTLAIHSSNILCQPGKSYINYNDLSFEDKARANKIYKEKITK